jgi:hypothetical protein
MRHAQRQGITAGRAPPYCTRPPCTSHSAPALLDRFSRERACRRCDGGHVRPPVHSDHRTTECASSEGASVLPAAATKVYGSSDSTLSGTVSGLTDVSGNFLQDRGRGRRRVSDIADTQPGHQRITFRAALTRRESSSSRKTIANSNEAPQSRGFCRRWPSKGSCTTAS